MTLQTYPEQARQFWQTYPLQDSKLQSVRESALSTFEKSGLPAAKNENYKYTNMEKKLASFSIKAISSASKATKKYPFDCYQVQLVNGQLLDSNVPEAIANVTTLIDQSEKVNKHLADTSALLEADPLFQLNTSLLHHGCFIEFKKSSDLPIVIHHHLDEEYKLNCKASHNIYHVSANVNAHILEEFSSNENSDAFNNNAITVIQEANSYLHHNLYNQQDKSNTFVNNLRVKLAKDAHYYNVNLNLGSKLSRYNIHSCLTEPGCHSAIHGLYGLQDDQHCDTSSFTHHQAPHTTSDQLYKGILNDKSRGVFTGMVRVDQHALYIDAKQLNKNMLLSKQAHANSRPQLEIFADDVKCSHGSTTGQIQDDELFYFESRGIKKEKAKQMLAKAFSYEVLLRIENKEIRDYLHNELTQNYQQITF
jgi:Fe-S cluster assembly protein SufD